jgi:hypothetical protein
MKLLLDENLPHALRRESLPVSIVVLSARSNDMDDLRPLLERLRTALANPSAFQPKTVTWVRG